MGRSAMSSRMFWRSMTPYPVAKRTLNVRIASTGNSTKVTAATLSPALPLPAVPVAQPGRRRAKHQVGEAAWTRRPLQNHQLHPPPPVPHRPARHQAGLAAKTPPPQLHHPLQLQAHHRPSPPPPSPPRQQHQPAPTRAEPQAGSAAVTTRPAHLPRPRRHPHTRHPRLPDPCPRLIPHTRQRPDGRNVSSGTGTVRAVDGKATGIPRSIYDLL